jgi:hypothetical protein
VRAFLLRTLAFYRILWGSYLLHGHEEVGGLGVGDGKCERSIMREGREGAGRAWEQFCGDIAGKSVLRGSRTNDARFGEDKSDEGDFLRRLPSVSQALV